MLILTTDSIPVPHRIDNVWSMIEVTYPFRIDKGFFGLGTSNEHTAALEYFIKTVQTVNTDINAIIGVKLNTTTYALNNNVYFAITYIGTPVKFTQVDALGRPLQK